MRHHGSFFTGLTALSLSLGLLAGCAAPTVPVSASPDPTPTAAPAAGQPAAPATPTMPAPAAVAPMTLTGTATFRGEPVAGYAVTVIDATTGKPVALRDDLAGATGLAVLNRNLKTDAQGKFSLQVVGLAAGKALRVQVSSGNGRLESILTANGQSLGAKGYKLTQAETTFTVTELTTAIAKVAGNVIRSTQVLTAEAAAPVIAKLATEMAALTTKLETTLASNPSAANQLVSTEGKTAEETVKGLVTNAGALKGLTETVAALVADIAKAMGTGASPAASDAKVREALAEIRFTGTVLVGSLMSNRIELLNTINGQRTDANGGTLSTVTTQVTPTSGSSGGASDLYVNVANKTELQTALAGTATHIRLTGDIGAPPPPPPYRVLAPSGISITRSVTIDGGNRTLYDSLDISASGVTISNVKATKNVYLGGASSTLSISNVTFSQRLYVSEGTATITNCSFSVNDNGLTVESSGQATVTGSTFTALYDGGGDGIRHQSGSLTATGNTFTNLQTGIAFDSARTRTISGNTFQAFNAQSTGIRIYYNDLETHFFDTARDTLRASNTFEQYANDDAKVKGEIPE
jgi:hypothetical protein